LKQARQKLFNGFPVALDLILRNWSASPDQLVIFAVVANPKPNNVWTFLHCRCAIVDANANGPESPYFLEVKRWMSGIAFE